MTPYDVLSRQLDAIRYWPTQGHLLNKVWHEEGEAGARHTWSLLDSLRSAPPAFCSREIVRLISQQSWDMPDWTLTPESLTLPSAFCWLEEPMSDASGRPHVFPNRDGGGILLRAVLWRSPVITLSDRREGAFLILFYDDAGKGNSLPGVTGRTAPLLMQAWYFGESTAERNARSNRNNPEAIDHADDEARFIACLWEFLRSKILVERPEPLPRAFRRRATGSLEAVPEFVRSIALRAKEYHYRERQDDQEERDWACRWLVRGHWRQQWYPSLQRHQPIFVRPYVKGPEDKPIRMPATPVFAVVR